MPTVEATMPKRDTSNVYFNELGGMASTTDTSSSQARGKKASRL